MLRTPHTSLPCASSGAWVLLSKAPHPAPCRRTSSVSSGAWFFRGLVAGTDLWFVPSASSSDVATRLLLVVQLVCACGTSSSASCRTLDSTVLSSSRSNHPSLTTFPTIDRIRNERPINRPGLTGRWTGTDPTPKDRSRFDGFQTP